MAEHLRESPETDEDSQEQVSEETRILEPVGIEISGPLHIQHQVAIDGFVRSQIQGKTETQSQKAQQGPSRDDNQQPRHVRPRAAINFGKS